jgi:NAD(P)-dependent dehydrogenase (short-subunit alcohol dehydrogenase family)
MDPATEQSLRYPEMKGKVAVVTGGTSGIGLAAALGFAREGAIVVVSSRNEQRAKEALGPFAENVSLSWIGCDTSDGKSVKRLIETVATRHGRIDYAFNNGGSISNKDIADRRNERGKLAPHDRHLSHFRIPLYAASVTANACRPQWRHRKHVVHLWPARPLDAGGRCLRRR